MQTRNKVQATTPQHQSTAGDQQKKIRPPGNNVSSETYLSLKNQGKPVGCGINGAFGAGQGGNTATAEDELLQDVMRLTEEAAMQNSGMVEQNAHNEKVVGQQFSLGNVAGDVKNSKKVYGQVAAATGTQAINGGVVIGQLNTSPQTAAGATLNKSIKPTNPMSSFPKKPVTQHQQPSNLIKKPAQQAIVGKVNNSNQKLDRKALENNLISCSNGWFFWKSDLQICLDAASYILSPRVTSFGGSGANVVHHSQSAAQLLGQSQVTILAGTKRSRHTLLEDENEDLQSQYSSKYAHSGVAASGLYNGSTSINVHGNEAKEEDSKVVSMNNNSNKQPRNTSTQGANAASANLQGATKRLKTAQSQVLPPQSQTTNNNQPSQPGKQDKPKAPVAAKGGLVTSGNTSNTLTKKNLEDLDRANHQQANKDSKLYSAAAASTKAADDFEQLSDNGKITTEQLMTILMRAHRSSRDSGVISGPEMMSIGQVQPQDTIGSNLGVSSSFNQQQQTAASAGKGLKKQQQFAKGGQQTSSQVPGKQVQQLNNQNARQGAGQSMSGGFHQQQVIEGKQSIDSAKKGGAQGNNQGASKKISQISHTQQQTHGLQPVIYDSNGQMITGQLLSGKDGQQVAGYMMDEIATQNAQYQLLQSLSPEVISLLPQFGNDLVPLTQQLLAHGYHNDANSLIAYIELTTPKLTQQQQQQLQEQGHIITAGALQEEEHQRQLQEALFMLMQQQNNAGGQQAIQITPEIIQLLNSMGINDPGQLSQQTLIDILVKSGAATSGGYMGPEYAQIIAAGGPQNIQLQSAGNLSHLHPYSALAANQAGPAGFTTAQIANGQDYQGLLSQHNPLLHQLNLIKPQKFSHVTIAYNIQRDRQQEMHDQQQYGGALKEGGSILQLQQQQMQNPTIIQLVGSANDEAAALVYQQALDVQMRNQILMSQQADVGGLDQQALLAAHVQQKLQDEANHNIYLQLKEMLRTVPSDRLNQVINEIDCQQPQLRPFLEQYLMEQQQQMEMDESNKTVAAMLAMTGKQSFEQLTKEEIMNCNQVFIQQQQMNENQQRQSIGGTDISGQQAPSNNGPPSQSNHDNAGVASGNIAPANNNNHQ